MKSRRFINGQILMMIKVIGWSHYSHLIIEQKILRSPLSMPSNVLNNAKKKESWIYRETMKMMILLINSLERMVISMGRLWETRKNITNSLSPFLGTTIQWQRSSKITIILAYITILLMKIVKKNIEKMIKAG